MQTWYSAENPHAQCAVAGSGHEAQGVLACRIEPLAPSHDRGAFDCSNDESVLRQTARQHIQKGISRTFVLTDSEQPETILGFLPIAV